MKQDAKTTEKKNDWEAIREDFPILNQKINGRPLIYLDNAPPPIQFHNQQFNHPAALLATTAIAAAIPVDHTTKC